MGLVILRTWGKHKNGPSTKPQVDVANGPLQAGYAGDGAEF